MSRKAVQLYDSKENPHHLGFYGEMLANDLLKAGWTEEKVGFDSHFWTSPDGEPVGKIDWAHAKMKRLL